MQSQGISRLRADAGLVAQSSRRLGLFLLARNPAASVKALAWRLTSGAWQIFRNRQKYPTNAGAAC